MKIKFFIGTTILLIVLSNCTCTKDLSRDYFDPKKDSIFYMNKLSEDAKSIIFSGYEPFWNVMLKNKIYISIYHDDHEHKFHFIIKEYGTDSINRFFYTYDMVPSLFRGLKYDSLEYDLRVFSKMDEDRNIEHTKELSNSFYNIHLLRKNSKEYQDYYNKYNNKLRDIEDIVNNMEVFKNFSFDNIEQLELLKRFLFHTRISTLSFYGRNQFNTLKNSLSYGYLGDINSISDLELFKENIDTTNYNIDKIWTYWKYQNYIFLNQNISVIEDSFKKSNTFILYSGYTDTKLFIYTIFNEDNKIRIEENYLNKNYYWYHPHIGIPKPGIRF